VASGFWSIAEVDARRVANAGTEPLGYAVGVATWLLAGGVFVAAKAVVNELPPWTLCFVRVLIAFLVLLPVVRHQIPEIRDFLRRRWLAVLIVGGLGLGITQGIMYQALGYTTAVNVGIIFATGPIMTMILARFILGERMSGGQAIGSLIALAGVVVIAVQGSLAVLLGLQFQPGDILVVLAAACFAVYTVLLKREKFELARLPLLVTLLGAAVVVTFPLFLVEVVRGEHDRLGVNGLLALAYVSIPGGALMYLFYNWSVELLGASKGGSLMYLQMIFTTALAWLILGEHVGSYHFAGAGLIAVGVVFILWLKPKDVVTSPR
jgi:drug/metabolite transporter (DMT)-like permease